MAAGIHQQLLVKLEEGSTPHAPPIPRKRRATAAAHRDVLKPHPYEMAFAEPSMFSEHLHPSASPDSRR